MHWASDSTTEWWNCLWRFSRALSNRLHVGKPHVYQMLSSLPTRIHDPLSQENHTSCKLLWQTKPFWNYAFPLHYHSTALVNTAWFQSTVEFYTYISCHTYDYTPYSSAGNQQSPIFFRTIKESTLITEPLQRSLLRRTKEVIPRVQLCCAHVIAIQSKWLPIKACLPFPSANNSPQDFCKSPVPLDPNTAYHGRDKASPWASKRKYKG